MTKKWIQKAIKHPGALHKQLGVPAGQKIPAKKLEKASHASGKLGQRARLAQTLGKMHHHAEGGGVHHHHHYYLGGMTGAKRK
jgi:hypothetical protein